MEKVVTRSARGGHCQWQERLGASERQWPGAPGPARRRRRRGALALPEPVARVWPGDSLSMYILLGDS